jgi:hypothetical protein
MHHKLHFTGVINFSDFNTYVITVKCTDVIRWWRPEDGILHPETCEEKTEWDRVAYRRFAA